MTVDLAALQHLLTGALIFAGNFALVVGVTAVGAAVTERSGILNLGHEGIMLLGAASGFTAAYASGRPWLGLLAGMAVGIGLGLLKGTWSVLLKTEQVINGLVLVPIGIGLSNVLYKAQFKDLPTAPRITPMEPLALPLLHKIPVLGPALFNRSPLVYLTLLLVAGVWYFLNRTRAGMIVRGAGESPEALDFSGVPVHSYRFLAVLVGTALTGFAGALLAVDQVYLYHPAMTAGRGWIAIAIVIVGGWRPWHCLLAALFFGFIDMLQFQFQIQSATVPYEALLSLPYLATVLALAWRRQGVRPPAALGVPFLK